MMTVKVNGAASLVGIFLLNRIQDWLFETGAWRRKNGLGLQSNT